MVVSDFKMMVKEHLVVTVHGGDGIFCLGFAGILACSFNMERLFFCLCLRINWVKIHKGGFFFMN